MVGPVCQTPSRPRSHSCPPPAQPRAQRRAPNLCPCCRELDATPATSPIFSAAVLLSLFSPLSILQLQLSLSLSSHPRPVQLPARREHPLPVRAPRPPPRRPELPRRVVPTCRPWCNLVTQQLEEVQADVLVLPFRLHQCLSHQDLSFTGKTSKFFFCGKVKHPS
jgi:hypothetical protein